MDRETVLEKVAALIRPFVTKRPAEAALTEDLRIIPDLGVNSARLVDIILTMEDDFGIAIDDQAAASVKTVGDAVNVIMAKTATAA